MHPSSPHSSGRLDRTLLRRTGAVAGALFAGAVVLGACGSGTPSGSGTTTTAAASGGTGTTTTAGNTGSTTTTAAGGAGALGSLATKLQGGATTAYDAVYKSTGTSGTDTVEIASQPPSSFAFKVTSASGTGDYLGNGKTDYACNQASGATAWSCVNFGSNLGSTYTALSQLYSGKYWASLLTTYKSDAAAAGVEVTSSSMTVAGVSLACVTYKGGAVGNGGEVCVTPAGVLGYVHSASNNETFELTSYSTSPPSSLFTLPAGATVSTLPSGVTIP